MYASLNEKNIDYSLKQGKKFNNHQNDYLQIVGTKKLNLIEQTTSPNLGFIEPMENNNSQPDPIQMENERVISKLRTMEDEFNKTLALYTSYYEQFYNKLLTEHANVTAYKRKNVKNGNGKFYYVNKYGVTRGYSDEAWKNKPSSCATNVPNDGTIQAFNSLTNGLDYVSGQPCNLDGSVVQNEDGKLAWIDIRGQRHDYPDRTTFETTTKDGKCPSHITQVSNQVFNMFPSASVMSEHSTCDTGALDSQLYNAINIQNQKLINIANQMYEESIKLNNSEQKVEQQNNSIQSGLLDKIQSLNKERDTLIALKNKNATLEGEYQSNNLQATSEYMRYILYTISALTIGGITYHVLTK